MKRGQKDIKRSIISSVLIVMLVLPGIFTVLADFVTGIHEVEDTAAIEYEAAEGEAAEDSSAAGDSTESGSEDGSAMGNSTEYSSEGGISSDIATEGGISQETDEQTEAGLSENDKGENTAPGDSEENGGLHEKVDLMNLLYDLGLFTSYGLVTANDATELNAHIAGATSAIDVDLMDTYLDAVTNISVNTSQDIVINGPPTGLGGKTFTFTNMGTGKITLKNMKFSGGNAAALTLNGPNADYAVEDCEFSGMSANGLKIGNDVKASVTNCKFDSNSAVSLAAGNNVQAEVTDCTFEKNTATALTSGSEAQMLITNCTFDQNTAEPGAIFPGNSSKFTVKDSSFIKNKNTASGGGAIILANGSGAGNEAEFTALRCYFYQNSSDSIAHQYSQGGAIRGSSMSNVRFNVIDSLFVENTRNVGSNEQAFSTSTTTDDGGAIAIRNSTGSNTEVRITGSTFAGNKAADDGGAMLLEGNLNQSNLTAYIANCTFTENTAGTYFLASMLGSEGGGVSFYGMVDSEITHCTFYKNTTAGSSLSSRVLGGGAVSLNTPGAAAQGIRPILSNNIFIKNTCTSTPSLGNVYLDSRADAGAAKNNGNVGYDNNEYPGYSQGENTTTLAAVTVANVFAKTTGSGAGITPLREYIGAVGSDLYNAERFCYIPSPLTDEMYRDGAGPYYDANVRKDVRGYTRDHYPNAGAVEIYWTKFDPGIKDGGEWVPADVPADAIRSLLKPEQFYLVTDPPPGNVNSLITFPRASITNTDNSHYSFREWESNQPVDPTAAVLIYPVIDPSTAFTSAKQTYTATWLYNPGEFRVDFNLQYKDGAGVPQYYPVQLVTAASKANKPAPNPSRPLFVFDGWYKEAGCINLWDFDTDTVNEDITLYAKWLKLTYKVSFIAGQGGSLSGRLDFSGLDPGTVWNTAITVPTPVPAAHYSFSGFSPALPAGTFEINANLSYTANFTIDRHTVSYNGNGHTNGTVPPADTGDYGEDVSVKGQGDMSRTGYNFLGWDTGATSSSAAYAENAKIKLLRDYILYAVWEIRRHSVIYNGNGHTDGTVPPMDTRNYGEDIAVKGAGNMSRRGYNFLGWSEDASASAADFAEKAYINMIRDYSLYAVWEIKMHTVTYDGNGHTAGSVPSAVTRNYGESVTVSDAGGMSREGYDFLGWSENAAATSPSYEAKAGIKLERNYHFYAVWKAKEAPVTPPVDPPVTPPVTPPVNPPVTPPPVNPVDPPGSGNGKLPTPETPAPETPAIKPTVPTDPPGTTAPGNPPTQVSPPPTQISPSPAPAPQPPESGTGTARPRPVAIAPPGRPAVIPALPVVQNPLPVQTEAEKPAVTDEGAGITAPEALDRKPASSLPIIDEPAMIGSSGSVLRQLFDGLVPLGGFGERGAWSMLSFLLSVLAFIMAVFRAVTGLRRRREELAFAENFIVDDEARRRWNTAKLSRLLIYVLGVLTPVVWLIIDDLNMSVVWINQGTISIGLLVLLEIIILGISRIRADRSVDEMVEKMM